MKKQSITIELDQSSIDRLDGYCKTLDVTRKFFVKKSTLLYLHQKKTHWPTDREDDSFTSSLDDTSGDYVKDRDFIE